MKRLYFILEVVQIAAKQGSILSQIEIIDECEKDIRNSRLFPVNHRIAFHTCAMACNTNLNRQSL